MTDPSRLVRMIFAGFMTISILSINLLNEISDFEPFLLRKKKTMKKCLKNIIDLGFLSLISSLIFSLIFRLIFSLIFLRMYSTKRLKIFNK